MDLLTVIWGLLQANSTAILAFAGAALGAMVGPVATITAARRAARAAREAAETAAAAAREVAAINERTAMAVAESARETQRLVERDRARFEHRRALVEPFLERVRQRASLYGDFFVYTSKPEQLDKAVELGELLLQQDMVEFAGAFIRSAKPSPAWVDALKAFVQADLATVKVVRAELAALKQEGKVSHELIAREDAVSAVWVDALDALHTAAEDLIFQ